MAQDLFLIKVFLDGVISLTKKSARKRNILYDLEYNYLCELIEKQNYICALSGLKLKFGPKRSPTQTTASIDRIDSDTGYIQSNVWWIDKNINLIKSSIKLNNILLISKRITEQYCDELQCLPNNNHLYINNYLNIVKYGAEKRNIIFEIDDQDALKQFNLQNSQCYFTGTNLVLPTYKNHGLEFGRASLDRLDSKGGYHPNNIVWVLKEINLSKLDYSYDEFIFYHKKIYEYNNLQDRQDLHCWDGIPGQKSTR
jgi:hypothetical protein